MASFSRLRTRSSPQYNIEGRIAQAQPKVEGTSTTYGQNITSSPIIERIATVPPPPTTQSNNGEVSTFPGSSAGSSGRIDREREEILNNNKVAPVDTLVRVVQNFDEVEESITDTGNISSVPCRVKSNISVAAASTSGIATVALPRSSFFQSRNRESSLAGSVLHNFSTIAPNVVSYVTVLGSSRMTKTEQKKALTEAQKIDLAISLKSKESESVEFSTLQTPTLESELVYNFFEEIEEDVEMQEDQSRDPLVTRRPVDTPRYIEIRWDIIDVNDPLTGTEKEVKENKDTRDKTFSEPRGVLGHDVTNFRNSLEKSRKKFDNVSTRGGEQLVDVHNIERGFEGISNSRVFSNTVSTVVSIQGQNSLISSIPTIGFRKF